MKLERNHNKNIVQILEEVIDLYKLDPEKMNTLIIANSFKKKREVTFFEGNRDSFIIYMIHAYLLLGLDMCEGNYQKLLELKDEIDKGLFNNIPIQEMRNWADKKYKQIMKEVDVENE